MASERELQALISILLLTCHVPGGCRPISPTPPGDGPAPPSWEPQGRWLQLSTVPKAKALVSNGTASEVWLSLDLT